MKTTTKFKLIIAMLFVAVNTQASFAQTKADVFDTSKPVTWLGLDFSLAKFIGEATKGVMSKNGTVTNEGFKEVYLYQWNQLFIDEMKKYDVAKAVNRPSVKYAMDVTMKANKTLENKDFFSENPADFKTVTEATIADAVKKYDFRGNEGIGLMFFIEGMSKSMSSEGMWVTFVDMKSKTVLLTAYRTEKPGGFGFRNYWAKPYYEVLKDMGSGSNFKKMNN